MTWEGRSTVRAETHPILRTNKRWLTTTTSSRSSAPAPAQLPSLPQGSPGPVFRIWFTKQKHRGGYTYIYIQSVQYLITHIACHIIWVPRFHFTSLFLFLLLSVWVRIHAWMIDWNDKPRIDRRLMNEWIMRFQSSSHRTFLILYTSNFASTCWTELDRRIESTRDSARFDRDHHQSNVLIQVAQWHEVARYCPYHTSTCTHARAKKFGTTYDDAVVRYLCMLYHTVLLL